MTESKKIAFHELREIECARVGTLVLRVGYRGGAFAGYAEQPNQHTVGGELREAFETLLRRPVDLTCAGRTDAGVHAIDQYVSLPIFANETAIDGMRLMRGLNALTTNDISIRGLYRADDTFSARFSALSRSYRYRLTVGARPVHGWGYVWWLRKTATLDIEAMRKAAQMLHGEHDFASFCKTSSARAIHDDGRSTCREINNMAINVVDECGDEIIAIDISANAFLHNMVRIIVGTLVEVGRGIRDADSVYRALSACDRRSAGTTAPACGLTLERVIYPQGSLISW